MVSACTQDTMLWSEDTMVWSVHAHYVVVTGLVRTMGGTVHAHRTC